MKHGVTQRVDHMVRQLVPASLVLVLVLLQAIPWHVPALAGVVPALPMIGIYYWSVYRPDLLVPSVAFATGLVNDVVLGAPIGVSSLAFLVIQGMTASQTRFFNGKSFLVIWSGFALLAAGALLIELVLESIVFGRAPLISALAIQYALTVCLYPLISWTFSRLQLFWLRNE
jgi:rod shape-determining protein MreD